MSNSTQNDEIGKMEKAINEGFAESERDLKDKKTPLDQPTQNDWEDRAYNIAFALIGRLSFSENGIKHMVTENLASEIVKAVADARREVIGETLEEIDRLAQGYESADYVRGWSRCRNVVAKRHRVLATLKEETL